MPDDPNVLTVSLLLPLESASGGMDKNFAEFYRGALLATEDLKNSGISVDVNVFNAPRDEYAVADIVDSDEFSASDLVIGPVYTEGMELVVDWARARGVAVVSPLSTHNVYGDGVLFQMAPAPVAKYDKLKDLLDGEGVNIIYVATSQPDAEMDAALEGLLSGVPTIAYSAATSGAELRSHMVRDARENVFVVSCGNSPQLVDEILSKISSVQDYLVSRGMTSAGVRVVGNSSWAWFSGNTVDRALYFKTGVCYVTNYHVDRTDVRVRNFDARYITAFGEIPPSAAARVYPYAYRGYDAVKLFGLAAMERGGYYIDNVNALGGALLQTSYYFERGEAGDWRNIDWPLVSYKSDYSIEVE